MPKYRKYNLDLINEFDKKKKSEDCQKDHKCNLFYGFHRTEVVKFLVGSLCRHHCQGGRDNDEKEDYEVDPFLNSQFEPHAKESSENRGEIVLFNWV